MQMKYSKTTKFKHFYEGKFNWDKPLPFRIDYIVKKGKQNVIIKQN